MGETYHISSNKLISIKDLVYKIGNLLKVNKNNLVKIEGERLGKDDSYSLSSQKIRKNLGWSDKINLDQGLILTKNWILLELEEIKKMNFTYKHKK